ncbi:hypothetical protein [Nioella sp.]|uniref:hypothetical protein n=1 Tax=Nioella sp. TaxID=1912091 RepID=UPI003B52568D
MDRLETALIILAFALVVLALLRRILGGRLRKPGLFSLTGSLSLFSLSSDDSDSDGGD